MIGMNIVSNYNSIYFGQKIPTSSFLKMGAGIFSFEDAKKLCLIFDQKFPGHVGYYKNALNYVRMIERKNPHLKQFLNNISILSDKNLKLEKIERLSKELGEEIDVVI